MNKLVMITKDDDGDIVPEHLRKWCVLDSFAGSHGPLCTGEVFGGGEGNAEALQKTTNRGGITCESCLKKIKYFKSVRL